MDQSRRVLSFLIVVSLCYCRLVQSQANESSYRTSVSAPWETNLFNRAYSSFVDGSIDRTILVSGKLDFKYACGFYCNGNCDAFLFAVFIIQTNTTPGDAVPPVVVWSANRNRLVGKHAYLNLTAGGLVLQDSDGSIAWKLDLSGKSVVSMNLTDTGNLVLFGEGNSKVWESFANPTDSLVPGQRLVLGQKLIPSVSKMNWTENGVISLTVTSKGLYLQVENPPQVYYKFPFIMPRNNGSVIFVEYIRGGLALLSDQMVIPIPGSLSSPQYLKLEFNGQLRAYNWDSSWKETDLLKSPLGDCVSPLVCGEYGICSNGQCTCPSLSSQPDEGCSEVNANPLSCYASPIQDQKFLDFPNVTYFTFEPDLRFNTINSCKEACAKDCSCKAAFFRQCINQTDDRYLSRRKTNDSCPGNCHLASRLFSLINMSNSKTMVKYTSTVYIKVQLKPVSSPGTTTTKTDRSNKSGRLPKVLGLSVLALISVIVLTSLLVCIARKRGANEVEEIYLDHVRGLPTRFSYGYLKAITDNFSRKLGEGAFGSVYEGTLTDGTKGAVKRLDGFDHITKSFLAEVESIGSIHHLNLVRLVGFCAERSHRLLVYEYMSNGSLDRWIFPKSNEYVLDWRRRKNIILDVARGLNYLHRDCRQKIIHMDIKPQNILLDENFNAKVADFGLSKLVDRDQSHVMTTMRGTPGYLAPEWLGAIITEKVDVYSFGVVTLEIVCGRRVFDRLKDPEEMHLLCLLKKKEQDGRLPDLIDRRSVDVCTNEREAVGMVRVAVWCMQGDFTRRPSMSTVIKVLEGTMDVPGDLSYDFFYQPRLGEGDDVDARRKGLEVEGTSVLLPSTLSGPR